MLRLLLAAFILSGAAGLIYESIWTRYLGLFVGHSAYAQIIVLAVFLGGMALGAALTARYTDRIRQPLMWYAGVEVAAGIGGFLFHAAFGVVTSAAYASVLPALGGVPLQFAKWTIAALLILPQSILLGATFPLMSAGAIRIVRARADGAVPAGRTLSLLYFANSLGAAGGVLLAGFFLVALFGLHGTLITAGLINLVAAGIALMVAGWLSDQERAPLADDDAPAAVPVLAARDPVAVRHALIVVAALTATASFIYEIAWVRMLSLVLGSATHSFELMLSAFILGLALGAWWIRKRIDSFRDPLRALAIVQWIMGILALATVPLYLQSFAWTANLIEALNRNDGGYTLFTIARYGMCLVIMLPATFCAGMTLPLITRTMMAAGGGERAIGTVYSVNTLGAIAGAGIAGLVLIPAIGLKGTLVTGAVMDMMLGVYLVARFLESIPGGRRLLRITAAGGAVVVVNIVLTQRFDHGVLTSGVYRYAVAPTPGTRTIAFYKDGRTATVSVRSDGEDGYSLSTNGKPDASLTREWLRPMAPGAPRGPIGGDQVTQAFLPLITLAHAPRARHAAVVGFGSGVSSHILLGSPELEELVTVEIEPAMAQASRIFHAANGRVYDDRRSTIVIDDAKSYFASAHRRFDLIMSEPSNPWVSGVAGLFTTEFYARVKEYLTEDGVFGQWLHLYEIDDALVMSVIAAVHRNFPAYEIFFTSNVDLLIVATPAARLPDADWSVLKYRGISEDLTRFRQFSPPIFEALRATNRSVLAPLLDGPSLINSDYVPVLDLGAERTRFQRTQASQVVGLGVGRFPLGLVLTGRRTPFGTDVLSPVQINRSELLALGAALRAGVAPPDTGDAFEPLRAARHRLALFRAQTAAGPPDSWLVWLRDALAVDEDLHGGSVGVADEQFFGEALGYAQRHRAPERVTTALHFVRAISRWDWAAADSAGARVMDLGSSLPGLAVDGDLLRDGLVLARLQRGDVAGARTAFTILSSHGERARDDVRNQLLDAWIRVAEADSTRR